MNDFILNEDQEPLERRTNELRSQLKSADPHQLAFVTGTEFRDDKSNTARFEFLYWDKPVSLPIQDFVAREPETNTPLQPVHQAMILYYFSSSKGSPPAGKWISFSELADGQFYNAAFQGYTSKRLLQRFGTDYQGFEDRCQAICGEKTSFGEGAFRYQILPRVGILAVYWRGDDEFPPSYKILFEDSVDYHLPTDACAILGSMLTGKLIAG